jgi:hypothetical protein
LKKFLDTLFIEDPVEITEIGRKMPIHEDGAHCGPEHVDRPGACALTYA